jgi:O-acetyl-ADP-ribose deacetylase (regulator of RNase III)
LARGPGCSADRAFRCCVLSAAAFFLGAYRDHSGKVGAGVDLSRVKESKGAFWTFVAGCEIRVVSGRLEDHAKNAHTAIVLPCSEYFDDRCVDDTRSALGAYVNSTFEGQVPQFVSLMTGECHKKLGPGLQEQKTEDEAAMSYGVGRCVLLTQPLGRSVTIALLSTTTQRVGQGLHSRISYLYDGMRELVSRLGSARINEVVMPVMGSGHGGVDPPLALVGLLGALAEAARYAQGSQRLKKVTIVVFKRDARSPSQVDSVVVQRALALIGSLG